MEMSLTGADVVSVIICIKVLLVVWHCIRMQHLVLRHLDLQALSI